VNVFGFMSGFDAGIDGATDGVDLFDGGSSYGGGFATDNAHVLTRNSASWRRRYAFFVGYRYGIAV